MTKKVIGKRERDFRFRHGLLGGIILDVFQEIDLWQYGRGMRQSGAYLQEAGAFCIKLGAVAWSLHGKTIRSHELSLAHFTEVCRRSFSIQQIAENIVSLQDVADIAKIIAFRIYSAWEDIANDPLSPRLKPLRFSTEFVTMVAQGIIRA